MTFFSTPDTLKAAGYSSGDVLQLSQFSSYNTGTLTSSSSSMGSVHTAEVAILQFDQFDVAPDDLVFAITARGDPNGDSLEVDFRNVDDSEIIQSDSVSGSGFQNFWSGWADYDPTTTASPVRVQGRFSNSDNATTVTLSRSILHVGVQL